MTTSYNGWPLSPARSFRTVPGTNVRLEVANGPAGDLLIYVAEQFHKRVESITGTADDWGYSYRKNVNNPALWSCHASATAIDLNALKHPNGKKNTFTKAQYAEIDKILAEVSNRVLQLRGFDEMHFEIVGNAAQVAAAAAKLGKPTAPSGTLDPNGSPGANAPPDGIRTPVKPTITRGSTGDDVKLVQRFLGITADGIFGVLTEAAVTRYQRNQGLTADGIVGPKTWERILSAL